MNKTSLIGAIIVALSANIAFANTDATASASATPTTNTNSKVQTSASAQATPVNAMAPALVDTSTTKITQKKAGAKKSPWGTVILSDNSFKAKNVNYGNFATSSLTYINVDYKFGKDLSKRVSVRPYFTFDTSQDGSLEHDKVMVRYRDSKMAKFWGTTLDTQFRYYFPVTAGLQKTGNQNVRMYNAMGWDLGKKLSLSFNDLMSVYGYTNSEAGQVASWFYHDLVLSHQTTKKVGFYSTLYYYHQYNNTGKNINDTKSTLPLAKQTPNGDYSVSNLDELGLTFGISASLIKNLSLDLSATQGRDIRDTSSVSFMKESEVKYNLVLIASM
ncbi:MAG: hypothetical protein HOO06_10695 [Bdellovibrionaceae bacterium]|nr:hypothetical protein [Pseudobdellovibrionaceae bacterium]